MQSISAVVDLPVWPIVCTYLTIAELRALRTVCKAMVRHVRFRRYLLQRLQKFVPKVVLALLQPERVVLTGSTMTQLVFDERYPDSDLDIFCVADVVDETLARLRALVPSVRIQDLEPYNDHAPAAAPHGMPHDEFVQEIRQGLQVYRCFFQLDPSVASRVEVGSSSSSGLVVVPEAEQVIGTFKLDIVACTLMTPRAQIQSFDQAICRASYDGTTFTIPFEIHKRQLRGHRFEVITEQPRCCNYEFKHWRWWNDSRSYKYAKRGFTPQGWCDTCSSHFRQGFTVFRSLGYAALVDPSPCDAAFWDLFENAGHYPGLANNI